MSSITIKSSNFETKEPRGKKTFDNLSKKVKILKKNLEDRYQYLEDCLSFYFGSIDPAKRNLCQSIEEFVKTAYSYNKKSLSKKDQRILEKIILDKIILLFSLTDYKETSPVIHEIFEELEGQSCDQVFSQKVESCKVELEEMLKEQGIDIDLGGVDPCGSDQDMMEQLMNAFKDAVDNNFKSENPQDQIKKSKKEIQKEEKARKLYELQKKGVGKVYKRLAKAIHPDLEKSPEKKLHKEEMMKKLTTAYKNNDFHAILSIEVEMINQPVDDIERRSFEDFKIYNSVLRDQINSLEEELEIAFLHPKYLPIQRFSRGNIYMTKYFLTKVLEEFEMDSYCLRDYTKDLQGERGLQTLKEILKIYSEL